MSSALAFWRWPARRWFRTLWILCTIGLLIALPLTVLEFKRSGYSVKWQAWFISGIFVLMAVPVTVYEVAMHLEHFSRPKLQIRVIRILWMVPIYAVDSWFALRFEVNCYAKHAAMTGILDVQCLDHDQPTQPQARVPNPACDCMYCCKLQQSRFAIAVSNFCAGSEHAHLPGCCQRLLRGVCHLQLLHVSACIPGG